MSEATQDRPFLHRERPVGTQVQPQVPPKKKGMARVLDTVERVGNMVPHPVMIFAALIVLVAILSHVFYLLGTSVSYEAVNTETGAIEPTTTAVQSLLTAEGIRYMFENVVPGFMSFTAVGVIIVAMLGVGVAEASGLIGALIHKLVAVAPRSLMTYILVFVGILSSIAADAGYLVLIPLAAAAFLSLGRHPLAGLAASFAGVAAVFTVNILVKPLDGILTEITNDAIALTNPALSIDLTANLWFSIASVLVLTLVVSWITERVIEPRLGAYTGEKPPEQKGVTPEESRGLRFALIAVLAVVAVFLLLSLPANAPLRNPETGALVGDSPLMSGLIVLVTILFFSAGLAYGIGARTMKKSNDVIGAMEKAVAGLGGLIFLLFVISQFISVFTYTNLATVAAVNVGDFLEGVGMGGLPLLLGFAVVVSVLDLIMTGAIPKWAIFAPIFVPLLMRLGVDPEAVLAAYRVGDGPMNSISPLNAYFALIVTFAHKYQKDAGVGTVVALMLPYVLVVFAVWLVLLAVWQIFGLPWGM